jgi:predicted RNase H-like nuclease
MADNAVRRLLGKRGSSVFPVPSRRAVFAEPGPFADPQSRRQAHQRACAIAAATSTPPRRITIFTFAILPKVRQVDETLRSDSSLTTRVFEVHPELAFRQLNCARVVVEPKTSTAGLRLRRKLLMKAELPAAAINSEPPKGAGRDDLLDALVCAVVARRIHAGVAQCFPDPPERDEFGLPMAIWA